MLDSEFFVRVEEMLNNIIDAIEFQDHDGEIDIDLNNNVLTLITDHGTTIINKQSAVKEIWLSSPISGPHHFRYTGSIWKSSSGTELLTLLAQELNINFSEIT